MNDPELIARIKEYVSIIPVQDCSTARTLDDITNRIKLLHSRKTLVPVICEDMYEFEDPYSHKKQSLHSYMVEKVLEEMHEQNGSLELTEQEFDDVLNKGYYGISLLYARNTNRRIIIDEELYNAIFKEGSNEIIEGIGLKKEVRDFLRTGDFPLIITTNSFPILEKELGSEYVSYWSEAEIKNDTPIPNKCIYHIFGEARPANSAWGYSDKQILRFLRSALSTEYSLKNLNEYINNKKNQQVLFFIGNDSPDWLFRFILSPIYGNDVYDESRGLYISDENHKDESSLVQFLNDIHFEQESQLMAILQNVAEKMGPPNAAKEIKHGKQYDIFVAHASEDNAKAEALVKNLRTHNLKVWADFEIIKDGFYWQRIIDGLQNSAYFMPLITENYILKTKDFQKQKAVLEKHGISHISFDKDEVFNLTKELGGVQVELLLAEQCFNLIQSNNRHQSVYSIPVIYSNETFFGDPLATERLERWGEQSRLPKDLFSGIQMYVFDSSNMSVFERTFQYNRYKNIN